MLRRDVRSRLRLRNRFSKFSLEPLESRQMLTTTVIDVNTTADENDGGTTKSLRDAIIEANGITSGDVEIRVPSGTYTLDIGNPTGVVSEDASFTGDLDLTTSVDVVIKHVGGGTTTIDAAGLDDRILDIHAGNVTIEGITFENGATPLSATWPEDRSGGAIRTARPLTVTDCTFSDNSASYLGGAIYGWITSPGSIALNVNGSDFDGNEAQLGGGIYTETLVTLSIGDSSSFENNVASNNGGALYIASNYATVEDSTFTSNTAAVYGGAIYNYGVVQTTITGSTFELNEAGNDGGAINQATPGGALTVSNSSFESNSAYRGGAITASGGPTTISDSEFTSNSAVGGGALHVSDTKVYRSNFSLNTAWWGGAIYGNNYGSESVFVYDSSIMNNSASGGITDLGGGGIYSTGDLYVEGTTIAENTSDYSGGGISSLNGTDRHLTVVNSTISGNSAQRNGGGIFLINSDGDLDVENSTIVLNRARSTDVGSYTGGGIYSPAATTLNNTIVAGNLVGSGTAANELAGAATMTGDYNLIGDAASTNGLTGTANLIGYSVGSVINTTLADNGGPTKTHALLPGSPAIDTGDPSFVMPPNYDQRGSGFTRVAGNDLDIGAYEFQFDATIPSGGRQIFYNNSKFDGSSTSINSSDDGAIATDKTPLLPGGGLAQPANVTSYSRGINGIMVDIEDAAGTLSLSDFTFKVGANNTPSLWSAAPTPSAFSVRAGAGVGGSDRVEITWADNDIQDTYLEVIVEGNDAAGGYNINTGLAASDTFFFGNKVGETFTGIGTTSPAYFVTNINDDLEVRGNPAFSQPVTNTRDFNRDQVVNINDELVSRNDPGILLRINISNPPASPLVAAADDDSSSAIATALAMSALPRAAETPQANLGIVSLRGEADSGGGRVAATAPVELDGLALALAVEALDDDADSADGLIDPVLESLLA